MSKETTEFNGKEGVWRTISGRKVFIAEGEDLKTAMKNSGKFKGGSRTERNKGLYEKLSKRIGKKKEKKNDPNKADVSYNTFLDKVTKNENEGKNYVEWKAAQREKAATGKYAATKHEGFGDYNDDDIPVYNNDIDYTGDFSIAKLDRLSNEELTNALNKQSELYHQAMNERLGDQRTRNGRMDKIFNTAKRQKYEKGMNRLNEEMQKRNMPRYNIYNEENNMILASSPTKEMADRQLKEMYKIDKNLQKEYGWSKLPKYNMIEETRKQTNKAFNGENTKSKDIKRKVSKQFKNKK